MTGSATWFIIHENGHKVNEQRIQTFLDWLQSWGHNYTRTWSSSFYLGNNRGPQKPWPYKRTGPGEAHDGMPRFDLTKPNKDYFTLLRTYMREVEKRDMYCSIMLFGSFNQFRKKTDFKSNIAWHPDNNVNPETKALKVGTDFFNMDPGVLALQEAHVRRMIDTLNEFDNFLWEIMNEAKLPDSKNWKFHIIDYVRDYEKAKPKQHLIIMSGGHDEARTILEDSPADIISPDSQSNDYMRGGPASYCNKIVINDTDHLWGFSDRDNVEAYRKWVWMTFTRGKHPVFMDDYDAYVNNNGAVNSAYNPVRLNLGYTLRYAQKLNDLASMKPSETISSNGFCLYNPGNEYLVYQPGPGSFTLNLNRGRYYLEWFDPNDGSVSTDFTSVNYDGCQKFSRPSHVKDDVVLFLKRVRGTTNMNTWQSKTLACNAR